MAGSVRERLRESVARARLRVALGADSEPSRERNLIWVCPILFGTSHACGK